MSLRAWRFNASGSRELAEYAETLFRPTAPSLRHLGDDLARDRVGDAEAAPEILEQATPAVEVADHVRAGVGDVLHTVPLSSEAVGAVAGLDHRGLAHAFEAGVHAFAGVQ